MGARPLKAGEPLFEVDLPFYAGEVTLKRGLLEEDPAYYFCGGAGTLEAQWEALGLVLESLAADFPQHFNLAKDGDIWRWENRLLDECHSFCFGEAADLPCEPLDWAGRQAQEDLVLVGAEAGQRFVGGQLCFANGWSIGSHIRKTFIGLHELLPHTNQPAVQAGQRLLESMKAGKTVWRMNWSFKLTDRLDLSTRHMPGYLEEAAARAPRLTGEDVGHEVFLRVERQTLTRLGCGATLFGIHPYHSRVEEEAADPERARKMLNVLRDLPPDVRVYKALAGYEAALLGYLEARCKGD
ncbi:MAG TPA: DUF3445 domain-containing protein [Anaerolinea sp.]|nr:DUF3445 domain-containing protein [Anaerolinea sp.]